MENWRRIFISRLAELKQSEGLTQVKLAELLDVAQSTIGQWHTGKRTPGSLEQFRALEKALKLQPGALTQPDQDPLNEPTLVAVTKAPYTSSIRVDIAEKATKLLADEIGFDGMEELGAAWVAETIVFLYDLLSDPASSQLNRQTIMQMVATLHRNKN